MHVFLGPSGVKSNENMEIAIMVPLVDKEDFPQLAQAMHAFLQDNPMYRVSGGLCIATKGCTNSEASGLEAET